MAQVEYGKKWAWQGLMQKFLRFLIASGAATAVDLILFYLLTKWAAPALWPQGAPGLPPLIPDAGVLFCTAVARICSAGLNFSLNKKFVFRLKGQKNSLWKYILLCISVMVADAALVGRIVSLLPTAPSVLQTTLLKAGVDTALFVANFFIQKAWVFPQKKTEE